MADEKPTYVDLEGYVLVERNYHEGLVACVDRASQKLYQLKHADWPGNISTETMKDRIRLLGFVLGTEDALVQ